MYIIVEVTIYVQRGMNYVKKEGKKEEKIMYLDEIIEDLDKEEKLWFKHLNKFGFEKQLTCLVEELNELQKVALKTIRECQNSNYNFTKQPEFIEEYIDVVIMLYQFQVYIDDVYVRGIIRNKIEKAKERINK